MVYVLKGSAETLARFWFNQTYFNVYLPDQTVSVKEYLKQIKKDIQRTNASVENKAEAYAYLNAVMEPFLAFLTDYVCKKNSKWLDHKVDLQHFLQRTMHHYLLDEIKVTLQESHPFEDQSFDEYYLNALSNPVIFLQKCIDYVSGDITHLKALALTDICSVLSNLNDHYDDAEALVQDEAFESNFAAIDFNYTQGDLDASMFSTLNLFRFETGGIADDVLASQQLIKKEDEDDPEKTDAFKARFQNTQIAYVTTTGKAAGFSIIYDSQEHVIVLLASVIDPLAPKSQQKAHLVLNDRYFKLTAAFKQTAKSLEVFCEPGAATLDSVWSWERVLQHPKLAVFPQQLFNSLSEGDAFFKEQDTLLIKRLFENNIRGLSGLRTEKGYADHSGLSQLLDQDEDTVRVDQWCEKQWRELRGDKALDFNKALEAVIFYLEKKSNPDISQVNYQSVLAYLIMLRDKLNDDAPDIVGIKNLFFMLDDVAPSLLDPLWWGSIMPVAVASGSPALTAQAPLGERTELIKQGKLIIDTLMHRFERVPSLKSSHASVCTVS